MGPGRVPRARVGVRARSRARVPPGPGPDHPRSHGPRARHANRPGRRPAHPARREHRHVLPGRCPVRRAEDRAGDGRGVDPRRRRQAVHQRRGRGLQLRVVHRAHRRSGPRRVRPRPPRNPRARRGTRDRRRRRRRVQRVRRLRPGGHQLPPHRRLPRGPPGRLRHLRVPRGARLAGGQPGRVRALRPRRPRPAHPARHRLGHPLHPPRLPRRRDRAHRHPPSRQGPPHLRQGQPHDAGVRRRPHHPRQPRLLPHHLRRPPLPWRPPVRRRRPHVPPARRPCRGGRPHVRHQALQHPAERRHPRRTARRGDVHVRPGARPADPRARREAVPRLRRPPPDLVLRGRGRHQHRGHPGHRDPAGHGRDHPAEARRLRPPDPARRPRHHRHA